MNRMIYWALGALILGLAGCASLPGSGAWWNASSALVTGEGELKSVRGSDLDAKAIVPPAREWRDDEKIIARSFKEQPPMVPHIMEDNAISLTKNTCYSCHWTKADKEKVTKIGKGHFETFPPRDISDLMGSRYACNLCHAPQMMAKPLVGNAFAP